MPAVRPTLRLLAALCALALPPAAAGQERLAPPVFLGTVTQANGTFELKFVLAKPGGDGRF